MAILSKSVPATILVTVATLMVSAGAVARVGSRIGALVGRAPSLPFSLIPANQQGHAEVGYGVALSANGRTALVSTDGAAHGSVYVLVRDGRSWIQQARLKLCKEDCGKGEAVALSADGNVALVGISSERKGLGAVSVFTRSGDRWRNSGRLRPSDQFGVAEFGEAVALADNGRIAFVGGPNDGPLVPGLPVGEGAVWVFVRNGNTWRQRGPKLTPPTLNGSGGFGFAIASSANGSELAIGTPGAYGRKGVAWFASRHGSIWRVTSLTPTMGSGEIGRGEFGYAVAMSGNGRLAMASAVEDNTPRGVGTQGGRGAVWAFRRQASGWQQEGRKLVSPKPTADGSFGTALALSRTGATALIGAFIENHFKGDAWIFRDSAGNWAKCAQTLTPPASAGPDEEFGYKVALTPTAGEALVGAPHAHNHRGSAWLYVLPQDC
jgi:hypothetical protein